MSKERYEVKAVPAYTNIHGIWDNKTGAFAPKDNGRPMRFAVIQTAGITCDRMNREDKAAQKAANDKEFEDTAPKVTANGTGKKPRRSKPKATETSPDSLGRNIPEAKPATSTKKPDAKAKAPAPPKNEHQGRRKKAA